MNTSLPSYFLFSTEVSRARVMNLPIVALESTVITHGLPYPENYDLARQMEAEVRSLGAVPATIAILDGRICVGLNDGQSERLGRSAITDPSAGEEKGPKMAKVSARDIGAVIMRGGSGGTTVAATMVVAHQAGIHVFATGGIGGVHRQAAGIPGISPDVSADLTELSRIPMIVVCAGAKAILDLPATLEMLETLSVPVVGYATDEFPAFYSQSSGLRTSTRVDRPEELIKLAQMHWSMGMKSALLVAVPPPVDTALPHEEVDQAIETALQAAYDQHIHGQAVTPFLLERVSELTEGESLRANLALLLNNARVAATIARYLVQAGRQLV